MVRQCHSSVFGRSIVEMKYPIGPNCDVFLFLWAVHRRSLIIFRGEIQHNALFRGGCQKRNIFGATSFVIAAVIENKIPARSIENAAVLCPHFHPSTKIILLSIKRQPMSLLIWKCDICNNLHGSYWEFLPAAIIKILSARGTCLRNVGHELVL